MAKLLEIKHYYNLHTTSHLETTVSLDKPTEQTTFLC